MVLCYTGRQEYRGRVSVRWAIVMASCAALLAGCGDTTPPITQTASPHVATSPQPTTVAGLLCHGSTPGTPLGKASLGCQQAWRPYGLTVVPPDDIVAAMQAVTLPAAAVHTTVPQQTATEAQTWANAWIRAFAWYIWAEENKQAGLVFKLAGGQVVSGDELDALQKGAAITYSPSCTQPVAATVAPMTAAGRAFFNAHFVVVDTSPDVVILSFAQPCVGTATFSDGHQATVTNITPGTKIVEAGSLHPDNSLGAIWFTDGATVCAAGAPQGWC